MAERPLFAFGLIADVQYADIDDGLNYMRTRRRFYRGSMDLLRRAVTHWEAERVSCVVQLGDIIDGYNKSRGASRRALDAVLREFERVPVDVHHVWGNHEFYNFDRETLLASPLNSAGKAEAKAGSDLIADDIYAYEFSPAPGFRFVLLDAYDVSVIGRAEGSDKHGEALRLLRKHNRNTHDFNQPPVGFGLEQRFVKFNGGCSGEQVSWLDDVLTLADQKQEKVIVFSHLPVLPSSTAPICLSWSFAAVLSVLRSHSSVVSFIAGHDHDGGCARDGSGGGALHLTLEGVIETRPDSDAFATVYVYTDRMVLKGHGRTADALIPYHNTAHTHTAQQE